MTIKHLQLPRRKVLFRHLLFWSLFITYEIACVRFTIGIAGTFLNFVLYYSLYIGLFYFNAHVVLDFAFFKTRRPYLVAAAFILAEIAGFGFLKILADLFIAPAAGPLTFAFAFRQRYLFNNVFRLIYFIGVSIAYWSTRYMIRFKDQNHRMETDRLTAVAQTLELENKLISVENAYLQNQVSPHLLFNSLNFIYNTVYQVSEKAGNGVMLLAELVQYSLTRVEDNQLLPIGLELAQIGNLIALNRLRFGDRLFLNFRKKGNLKTVRVLPLILITLVENMMKHGDLGEPGHPGLIRLEVKDGTLLFETKNKKRRSCLYPESGLGLRNIEKRLANAYPGRYRLELQEDDHEFTVLLKLNL